MYGIVQIASQINQFFDSKNLETRKDLRNNFTQDKDFKIWRNYKYISRTDNCNNAMNWIHLS